MNLGQIIYLDEEGRLRWRETSTFALAIEVLRQPIFAMVALCSPTRPSGLTGHWIPRHHVHKEKK